MSDNHSYVGQIGVQRRCRTTPLSASPPSDTCGHVRGSHLGEFRVRNSLTRGLLIAYKSRSLSIGRRKWSRLFRQSRRFFWSRFS